MDAIPKSGFYLPNNIARITLLTLEEVMGKNGLNAILNMACLPERVEAYPPDNWDCEFDFADFSAIQNALQEMYGKRSGRGLAVRCGRAIFTAALRDKGPLAGVRSPEFQALPLERRLWIGLSALARVSTQASDLIITVEEQEEYLAYTIRRCPVCWGQHTEEPACYVMLGLLLEGLQRISGGHELQVVQQTARSMGAITCDFFVYKR